MGLNFLIYAKFGCNFLFKLSACSPTEVGAERLVGPLTVVGV